MDLQDVVNELKEIHTPILNIGEIETHEIMEWFELPQEVVEKYGWGREARDAHYFEHEGNYYALNEAIEVKKPIADRKFKDSKGIIHFAYEGVYVVEDNKKFVVIQVQDATHEEPYTVVNAATVWAD